MDGVPSIEVAELEDRLVDSQDLLLVHFHSPLASSCQLVHSVLEALEPRYRDQIEFWETEVPLLQLEAVRSFRIREVPTLILFHQQTGVERLQGIVSPEELTEFLELARSFYAD